MHSPPLDCTQNHLQGRMAPVVAGHFYPRAPDLLARQVDGFLDAGRSRVRHPGARVIIAPHAGYPYSGSIAGTAFAVLDVASVRRVVIIGPSHYVSFDGVALPAADRIGTPLGDLALDIQCAQTLLAETCVHIRPEAFLREHCVEVMLPFVQRMDHGIAVVPLVVGLATPAEVAAVFETAWDAETALVVSSDLSHFLAYDQARQMDRETASAIRALDNTLLAKQACGAAAINGLLAFARGRMWQVETLDLRNSGDTAGGRDQVVGYGAFAFSAP